VILLELDWGEVVECAVEAAVVVPVDPAGGGVLDVADGPVGAGVEDGGADALGLVQADHALHERVVVRVADGADRGSDAFEGEVLGEPDRGVLRAGICVSDQLAGHDRVPVAVALPDRHPQRRHDQIGVLRGCCVPGDDALGEDVDDERDVDEAGPGAHVGEVHDPGPVRCRGGEVPVQQVAGASAVLCRDRRADAFRTPNARQAKGSHRPVHRARSGVGQEAAHERGHLSTPIQSLGGEPAAAVLVDGPGQLADLVLDEGIRERARRNGLGGLAPGSIGPRGDLAALLGQDSTDRLDRSTRPRGPRRASLR